jgi:hypothetical protein
MLGSVCLGRTVCVDDNVLVKQSIPSPLSVSPSYRALETDKCVLAHTSSQRISLEVAINETNAQCKWRTRRAHPDYRVSSWLESALCRKEVFRRAAWRQQRDMNQSQTFTQTYALSGTHCSSELYMSRRKYASACVRILCPLLNRFTGLVIRKRKQHI